MNTNKLEISLIESIGESNISEVVGDGIEISIDSLITDDLLKEIPIVKTVVAISKGVLNVRDYLFLKKVIIFLNEVNEIDLEKRKKFVEEIEKTDKLNEVGVRLMEIIDKTFFEYKAKIIGLLFASFLETRSISQLDFFRLSEMVSGSYESDLRYFFKTDEDKIGETGNEVEHLLAIGFYERPKKAFGDRVMESRKPAFSFYGKMLHEVKKSINN